MRRELDAYLTPWWVTDVLLERVSVFGHVCEPCAGMGDIVGPVALAPRVTQVSTNDLDPHYDTATHLDATDLAFWRDQSFDWVVTNPPFLVADKIIPLAVAHAGNVAMLLRLTYLEPCEGRATWLAQHPPSHLIVLPRISFTGDGKTDSVTCAWMVWGSRYQQSIEIVPRASSTAAVAPLFTAAEAP